MDPTLFKSLANDWEAHGEADPFFGVLSDPGKRGGQWDAGAFFESGRVHIANLMGGLRDAGIDMPRGACLDFGCGLGRLTQPFCDHFQHVTGVDVASSMIRQARRYNAHGDHCRFVVNRSPDLRQFADATFDLVHSCIVLQHMPPPMSLAYVGEFFRVCKPNGAVVFQLPAALRPAELSAGALALPPAGYRAELSVVGALPVFRAGEHATVHVRVTNAGPVAWAVQPPTDEAGHIRVANHWLTADGDVLVRDDGRGLIQTSALRPGEHADVSIVVRAPQSPGTVILELDLVQELVTWFAEKGSRTLCVPVEVLGEPGVARERPPTSIHAATSAIRAPRKGGLFRRLFRPPPVAKAAFPMHVVPRPEVEQAIASHGGWLLRVFEDEACGHGWVSYTYVARK